MGIQRWNLDTRWVSLVGHTGVALKSDTGRYVEHADHIAYVRVLEDALEAKNRIIDKQRTELAALNREVER